LIYFEDNQQHYIILTTRAVVLLLHPLELCCRLLNSSQHCCPAAGSAKAVFSHTTQFSLAAAEIRSDKICYLSCFFHWR